MHYHEDARSAEQLDAHLLLWKFEGWRLESLRWFQRDDYWDVIEVAVSDELFDLCPHLRTLLGDGFQNAVSSSFCNDRAAAGKVRSDLERIFNRRVDVPVSLRKNDGDVAKF